MPTGYTAPIADDEPITPREYLIRAARGMGYAILQRDEPLDQAPAEVPTEDTYYKRAVREAEDDLRRLLRLNKAEVKTQAEAAHLEALVTYHEAVARREALIARYEFHIDALERWDVDAALGDDFDAEVKDAIRKTKEFALNQLRESLRFDTGYAPTEPQRQTPAKWHAAEVASAQRWLKQMQESLTREQTNNAARNECVRALKQAVETL